VVELALLVADPALGRQVGAELAVKEHAETTTIVVVDVRVVGGELAAELDVIERHRALGARRAPSLALKPFWPESTIVS